MTEPELQVANGYVSATVSDESLREIQRDLKESNELVAYRHNPDQGTVECVLDLSQISTNLTYIQ